MIKLTKADKQMFKNLEIAFQIVLLEDKKLLEELSKK